MRPLQLGLSLVVAGVIAGACSSNSSTPTPTPTKVAFTVQPTAFVAGAVIAPAVKVSIEDVNGAVVTSSTAPVTVAIGTNPAAGTLSGTMTVNAVAGVATFSNLSIDNPGTGYTLAASSAGLTGAASGAFNVTAPPVPTKLGFTVQPSNVAAGAAITPGVSVAIQDVNGVTVTTSTASVTIAIGTNPAAGTLSGTTTVNAVAGVATFSNLTIDNPGTGYTLTATSAGLTDGASAAFNVTVPPPAPVEVDVGGASIRFTSVNNGTFNPATDTVSVASGRAVRWTWRGGSHGVQSTGLPAFTGSGAAQSTGTYSFTFTTPGTYTYDCLVHGALMTGAIVVIP